MLLSHSVCASLLYTEIDVKEEDGCTALYIAAQQGHKDVVELLISSGAGVCVCVCVQSMYVQSILSVNGCAVYHYYCV